MGGKGDIWRITPYQWTGILEAGAACLSAVFFRKVIDMKKYKRIQKNNYDTKKREPILIAILAVLIAFMDISGIPSTLLFRIQIGDIESVYFSLISQLTQIHHYISPF